MALRTCPECRKEMSSKAKACPHCGAGTDAVQAHPWATVLIVGLGVLFVV
jgi:RNA polymerase subunit RPABC4/transcription elongation factor Spt4